jgi:hypothetical protein
MRRKPNFWFLLVVTYLSTLIFASEGMFDRAMTVPVEVSYNLSPTDSRVSATEAARDIARQDAASRAGTYIEGVTKLENDNLSETIREVQTSVVRLENERTEFSVSPSAPNGRITLIATAIVDTSALESRVRALRENRDLQKKVQALARENTRLKSEIREISDSDATGIQRLNLEKRRLRLEGQISENRDRLLSAFDGGSLLDFRKKEDVHLGVKNQELQREVIDRLMSVQVYADIDSASGDNTHTTAKVRVVSEPAPAGVMHRIVGWFLNPTILQAPNPSKDDLNRDMSIYDFRMKEQMNSMDNFNIHAESQRDHLSGFLLATEVTLGSRKSYLPVMGVSGTRFGRVECEKDALTIEEVLSSDWARNARSNPGSLSTAICIFNSKDSQDRMIELTVTNKEAAGITSISAKRVLIDLQSGQAL